MVKSMFAGVSGLRAHQSKMDVIGNNISNVNTWGYKAQRVNLSSSFYQTLTASSAAGGGYGGGNPSQVGYGAQVGSIDVLHTRGGYAPTDGPMDSMINGNGYYLVGPKRLNTTAPFDPIASYDPTTGALVPGAAYDNDAVTALNLTRVGSFGFDGAGNLIDSQKNVVYGFLPVTPVTNPITYNESNIYPISLPLVANPTPGGAPAFVPVKLSSISVASDGTITGIDDSKNIITVGKLAIANVPNPNALEATQGSYYKAKENTGLVEAFFAGKGSTGLLQPNGLEMANVDLSKEFTDMITTQRGFQANTRIITVTDEMLADLVSLKR